MFFLYNIFMNLAYKFALPFGNLFFGKYNLPKRINIWNKAQKKSYSILSEIKKKENPSIWFHCASLGEYEQIKPIVLYCQENIKNHTGLGLSIAREIINHMNGYITLEKSNKSQYTGACFLIILPVKHS